MQETNSQGGYMSYVPGVPNAPTLEGLPDEQVFLYLPQNEPSKNIYRTLRAMGNLATYCARYVYAANIGEQYILPSVEEQRAQLYPEATPEARVNPLSEALEALLLPFLTALKELKSEHDANWERYKANRDAARKASDDSTVYWQTAYARKMSDPATITPPTA